MSFSWMAWTLPTAIFFGVILCLLVVMTVLEIRWPTRTRRGLLPLATTRGDRLFIGLLLAAFLHILWLAALDAPVLLATGISLALLALLIRWG
jgi:predicted small integral membrane protein